jgi:hypothetical protein
VSRDSTDPGLHFDLAPLSARAIQRPITMAKVAQPNRNSTSTFPERVREVRIILWLDSAMRPCVATLRSVPRGSSLSSSSISVRSATAAGRLQRQWFIEPFDYREIARALIGRLLLIRSDMYRFAAAAFAPSGTAAENRHSSTACRPRSFARGEIWQLSPCACWVDCSAISDLD